MKLATTPEEQRQWMAQWREAAIAMEESRHRELTSLTQEEALRASEAVQSFTKPWRRPEPRNGLVEQQAWFQRWFEHERSL